MAPTAKQAVSLVVGLLVFALLAAMLLPVAVGAMDGTESATYTQDTAETITIAGQDLNATLDAVDTSASPSTADYTITAGGDSATATGVAVGSNTTVTVNGNDVTIAPQEVNTGNATNEYTYPTTYGWGGAAGALWLIIPVLLIIAAFLFLVKAATQDY